MKKKSTFQFKVLRPGEEGVKKALYDLEAEIMELVWSLGSGFFTVRDVLNDLNKKKKIAYTTVMTTIDRLRRKGLLDRNKNGKTYFYAVKITKKDFLGHITDNIISSLPEKFNEPLFSHFVRIISKSDVEQLDKLEKLLEERRKRIGS